MKTIKRTKKEIRQTYLCQLSMNRLTDDLIHKAIYELNKIGNFNPTKKEIVNKAYEIQ